MGEDGIMVSHIPPNDYVTCTICGFSGNSYAVRNHRCTIMSSVIGFDITSTNWEPYRSSQEIRDRRIKLAKLRNKRRAKKK